MRYVIIDIGSNTVKAAVYSINRRVIENVGFLTTQLGLIAKIQNGILPSYAIDELCDTINEYIAKADALPSCFATESLRRVDNLEEVTDAVKERCKIDVTLISSEDEALLSFSGFLASAPDVSDGIMADMGGGSTELLKFSNRQSENLHSFRFGCLSLRRDYVKGRFPTRDELDTIRARVDRELKDYSWVNEADRLCLVGGTGSSVGKLAFELGYTTTPEFASEKFIELFDYLMDINDQKISLLEKHIPARVETILPGMCAFRRIIETVNANTVFISKGGIREGFLYRKLKGTI